MIDLSICIVHYKTGNLLRNCILSIYRHTKGLDFEIIVVDNSSQDNSLETIESEFKGVSLVANRENIGFAAAVNQAIKKSKGEYILVLNPDTIILQNAISKSLSFIKGKKDAGIVGCKILNPDGSLQPSCKTIPGILSSFSESSLLYKIFPQNRFLGTPYMTYFDYNKVREVDVVNGAFLMFKQRLIEQIGLLDERFFIYSEETDWCYRATKAGFKNYFYPDAQIIHYGGESTRQKEREMFIELHKSKVKFCEKHNGKLASRIIISILLGGIFVRAILWTIICLCKKNKLYIRKRDIYLLTMRWWCCQK